MLSVPLSPKQLVLPAHMGSEDLIQIPLKSMGVSPLIITGPELGSKGPI